MPRTFRVTGLDRTDYMVKDLPRAIAFYRDVIGLKLLNQAEGKGAEFELLDGVCFGLWVGGNVPFQPGNGVMFGVSDLRAAVAGIKDAGVAIVSEFETPFCFIATLHDTEGNLVNLHKRKDSPEPTSS